MQFFFFFLLFKEFSPSKGKTSPEYPRHSVAATRKKPRITRISRILKQKPCPKNNLSRVCSTVVSRIEADSIRVSGTQHQLPQLIPKVSPYSSVKDKKTEAVPRETSFSRKPGTFLLDISAGLCYTGFTNH